MEEGEEGGEEEEEEEEDEEEEEKKKKKNTEFKKNKGVQDGILNTNKMHSVYRYGPNYPPPPPPPPSPWPNRVMCNVTTLPMATM